MSEAPDRPADGARNSDARHHEVRQAPPYMLGAYLAVNAIPDAAIVVDGPTCSVPKAEQIHGNHDWHSTLLSADRAHRVVDTGATVTTVTADRRDEILRAVRGVLGRDSVRLALLGALPMASITEPPYDFIVEDAADEFAALGKVVVELPRRALARDWLGGYADTLAALAEAIPLPDGDPRPERVALVGYLMDRSEADHRANLGELRRLLEGCGLELVSTWLGGDPSTALPRVADAGTIVALPYALEAARTLARRTGATLVETGLPMGLEGTSAWLRAVAAAAGRDPEPLIAAELADAAPRLEWVVPFLFVNTAVGFLGDPHLLRGFVALMHELGARVPYRVAWCRDQDDTDDLADDALDDPVLVVDPRASDPGATFRRLAEERDIRLLVGNAPALQAVAPGCAVVELGFPSWHSHALFERPFLGYRGTLCLLDRCAESMRMHEARVQR